MRESYVSYPSQPHRKCEVQLQGHEMLVSPDLEVAHIPYERGGPYPGIYMFSHAARMMRPVLQMKTGTRELIGTLEQIDLNIR